MGEAPTRDGVPTGPGWFVVNAAATTWDHDRLRSRLRFGGEGPAHFDEVGVAMYWLEAGQAMSLYHHEAGQEDFLVLRGEPVLIVEEVERRLRPWDLVHCPPRTPHAIVNPDDGPAADLRPGGTPRTGQRTVPTLCRRPGARRRGRRDLRPCRRRLRRSRTAATRSRAADRLIALVPTAGVPRGHARR
jgi:uncharacterized cupin superfamily protein